MKKNCTRSAFLIALSGFAVGSSAAYAATLAGGYVVAGATELRPLAVAEINGQTHLQFPAKRATDLPVPFALGDDGHLSLVNFKESDANGSTEYVLDGPVTALVLKHGEREAIVQRGDKCSLNGVKITGSAKVTCAE
ncbi:TrbG/VirB9 family P-type conjugative transfer protein [Paraburkholderia ultramafica]|nr:TrbG/VirB9 family P-type conjugative transfer protein [Paraburkholderia ultramafica]